MGRKILKECGVGQLAAEVLDFITPHVVPGVSTEELDRLCHDYIVERDAIPAPLNYRGFEVDLHISGSCCLPWHSGREETPR